jgi:hypothetical protein
MMIVEVKVTVDNLKSSKSHNTDSVDSTSIRRELVIEESSMKA